MKTLVVVPESENFQDNVTELKSLGFKYHIDRRCWFGEAEDRDLQGIAVKVGEFDYRPMEHWGIELTKAIDLSCDFTIVGRRNA